MLDIVTDHPVLLREILGRWRLVSKCPARFFLFPNFLEPLFLVCYATVLMRRREDAPRVLRASRGGGRGNGDRLQAANRYAIHVAHVDRSELLWRMFGS